jgi:hypothetical protein
VGNKWYLLRELYERLKCTVWKNAVFNVTVDVTYIQHWALNG